MDERSIRSLDVLLDQARLERAQQLRHFDALDGKAGILLGFAGALIALAPAGFRVALDGGRAAAVVAAYFAIRTFWPRSIPITDLLELRRSHAGSDEAFIKLALVDNQIDTVRQSRVILRDKAATQGVDDEPRDRVRPHCSGSERTMTDMAEEHEPQEGQEPPQALPPLPPYAPDPQLIDLMERGAHMTDEEARLALARDVGGS